MSAVGDGEDLRDDLALDDRARADLQLVLDHDATVDLARDDRLAGLDVALPARGLPDAEHAADGAVAAHGARHHELAARRDIAHDGRAFGNDGGRQPQFVGQTTFWFGT